MYSRPFQLIALVLPLAIGTMACGSSEGAVSTPPSVVSNNDPANSAAPSDAAAGANPEVEAYCTAVDDFVEVSKKMIADPLSADAEAVTKQSLDLVASATALAASVTGDDTARLEECSAKFAQIGS